MSSEIEEQLEELEQRITVLEEDMNYRLNMVESRMDEVDDQTRGIRTRQRQQINSLHDVQQEIKLIKSDLKDEN